MRQNQKHLTALRHHFAFQLTLASFICFSSLLALKIRFSHSAKDLWTTCYRLKIRNVNDRRDSGNWIFTCAGNRLFLLLAARLEKKSPKIKRWSFPSFLRILLWLWRRFAKFSFLFSPIVSYAANAFNRTFPQRFITTLCRKMIKFTFFIFLHSQNWLRFFCLP